jgi:hypothetical protein
MELVGAILRAVFFEFVLSALETLVRETGRLIRALLRWALRVREPASSNPQIGRVSRD